MKFRINTTGSIVEPNDETVLEQMKNSPFYTAIPDVEPDAQEGDNEGVKPPVQDEQGRTSGGRPGRRYRRS